METPKTKMELLYALFDKYNLYYDKNNPDNKSNDVFRHKHYTIITRGGIQKIEKLSGITCDFNIVSVNENHCVILGTGTLPDGKSYKTTGSASRDTSSNPYYAEMAEKRFRSRVVLTLTGLYQEGVFGEDEADDFSTAVNRQRSGGVSVNKTYKSEE